MQKILLVVLSAVVVFAVFTKSASTTAKTPADLKSYVGKYPSQLFKEVPSLKTRLRKVLAADYAMFMGRMQTEMPIELDEGSIVVIGCMAHSCTVEDSIMVIQLDNDKLHCAMRSDKFKGYKVYSEDKENVPKSLYRALERY